MPVIWVKAHWLNQRFHVKINYKWKMGGREENIDDVNRRNEHWFGISWMAESYTYRPLRSETICLLKFPVFGAEGPRWVPVKLKFVQSGFICGMYIDDVNDTLWMKVSVIGILSQLLLFLEVAFISENSFAEATCRHCCLQNEWKHFIQPQNHSQTCESSLV